MHAFRKFILQYVSMNAKDWQRIEVRLKSVKIPANTMILEEGQICRYLYFLESGTLRYFSNIDGRDAVKFFTQAPYCFTSQRSFNLQAPSSESIQSLEDCVLYAMTRKDVYELMLVPSWSQFALKLMQEVQHYTQQILESSQNETAEQRYIKMIQSGDSLLQKVSLKDLASYLGIAPQSLSRIRKKMITSI